MTTALFLLTVVLILGVTQLYAGAGGVEPISVRIGQALCSVAILGFAVAAAAAWALG